MMVPPERCMAGGGGFEASGSSGLRQMESLRDVSG